MCVSENGRRNVRCVDDMTRTTNNSIGNYDSWLPAFVSEMGTSGHSLVGNAQIYI